MLKFGWKGYGLDSKIQTNTNPGTGELLEYPNLEKMRACLEEHKDRVAAVVMECLHGVSRLVLIPCVLSRSDLC